jgi:hypothetical protein
MPKYRIPLANGKSLVLEGETEPTVDDVQAAAEHAGVRSLLMRASDDDQPKRAGAGVPGLDSDLAPAATAVSALGAALPAVVGGAWRAAGAASKAAPVVAPALTAIEAGRQAAKGNYGQAVQTGINGAVASSMLPKLIRAMQQYLGPVSGASAAAKAIGRVAAPVAAASLVNDVRRDLVDYASDDDPNLTPTERAAREAIAAAIRGGGVL